MAASDHLTPAARASIQAWVNGFDKPDYGQAFVDFEDDGTINVGGGDPRSFVGLKRKEFTKIPAPIGKIPGSFSCTENDLQDLTNSPQHVPMSFYLGYQPTIKSLRGGPQWVGHTFDMQHSWPESMEGLPRYVGESIIIRYHENLPVLRLLMVGGSWELDLRRRTFKDAEAVLYVGRFIEKYKKLGANGVMPCAAEMIKAGYRGNARL
jgi:hypothetical protein